MWAGVNEASLRTDPDGTIVPNLALSWNVSPDGLTETLQLRKGVQFHGTWGEMTSADWVWTADDQWVNPNSNHGGQFIARNDLKGVSAPDPYTVTISLKQPNSFFREYYGAIADDIGLGVYSKKRVETLGTSTAKTALPDGGTGPYEVKKWIADSEIDLSYFPNYWGHMPQYANVKILQMTEPTTILAALKTGQIDASLIPSTLSKEASDAGLQLRQAQTEYASMSFDGEYCVHEYNGQTIPARPGYDPSRPWVGQCDATSSMQQATDVRFGMDEAIDRNTLIQSILGGQGSPVYVESLVGYFGKKYMENKWITPYSTTKAKQDLTSGGYPNGFKFTVLCPTGAPLSSEFCQAISSFWSAIGLTPTIQNINGTALRNEQVKRQINDIVVGLTTGISPIPEARELGDNPISSLSPGYEVNGLYALVVKAGLATSSAALDAIRAQEFQTVYEQHYDVPIVEFNEPMAVNPKKIGAWPRTPWNGQQQEIGDFDHLEKPS